MKLLKRKEWCVKDIRGKVCFKKDKGYLAMWSDAWRMIQEDGTRIIFIIFIKSMNEYPSNRMDNSNICYPSDRMDNSNSLHRYISFLLSFSCSLVFYCNLLKKYRLELNSAL